MGQAQCLEVLFTDKQQSGVIDSRYRRGIAPAIEDGKFGDGTAGTINTEYLFASVGRTLEDSDVAGVDDVESGARLALAKYALSRRIGARPRMLREKTQF